MLIVRWAPIRELEKIPPFQGELAEHLRGRRGRVLHDSCSVWELLYRMLEEAGLPPGTVAFTETGKPYFEGSGVFFSLSHSKDVCAAAVADRPVGVDVEICRESYNPRLIRRSLTEAELAVFDGDFTRIWCRKEAAGKMTGEGITGFPRKIETLHRIYEEQRIEYGGSRYWLAAVTEDGAVPASPDEERKDASPQPRAEGAGNGRDTALP